MSDASVGVTVFLLDNYVLTWYGIGGLGGMIGFAPNSSVIAGSPGSTADCSAWANVRRCTHFNQIRAAADSHMPCNPTSRSATTSQSARQPLFVPVSEVAYGGQSSESDTADRSVDPAAQRIGPARSH